MTVHEMIAAVASTVRDSGDGQGVFYHAGTRTVYWSGGDSDFCGDWGMTEWEPVKAALLNIDGVDHVELHAEDSPHDDDTFELLPGWTQVPYTRSADVQAWDRWIMIEVMRLDEQIVHQVILEAGGEILPYPDDCPRRPRS